MSLMQSTCDPDIKRTGTLTFRLVTVFSLLLAVIIMVLTVASVTMLRSYLTRNLDDDLNSSGKVVASEAVKFLGAGFPSDDQASLSDYYVYAKLHLSNNPSDKSIFLSDPLRRISDSTLERYGEPEDIDEILDHTPGEPFTVSSTRFGGQWRVVVLKVTDGLNTSDLGTIVIGRPMAPTYALIGRIATGIMIVAISVAAFGAIIAFFLIRSSLRPLHGIEKATHRIADGDLSQRVPTGKPGSEVAHLAESINIMLEQIEHSFSIKEQSEHKMRQFVSDASHELRTPLATVRGYAELYRIGGVPADQVPATMERMESEAKRMSGLVEDLLQLARLDEGRPLNITDVCVTEVAMNAVMDFRVRAKGHPAVVVGLDGGPAPDVTLRADQDKITQIITNLLSNVLTHTPADTAVEVAVGNTTTATIIEVRDHGPGVKPEDINRIFERFYRADYSRSRTSGGSGLGLAIVASIMKAHGGNAQVRETPGGGLTVRLTFPLEA